MIKRAGVVVLAGLALQACDAPTPRGGAGAPVSYAAAVAARDAGRAGEGPSLSAEQRAVIDRANATLTAALPDPGIAVGERAPQFELINAFGQRVSLAANLAQGPVVLVFYRGAWCPYCNLHLNALQKTLPRIEAQGASLIAVTPQKPDRSAQQISEAGYPFEVLSDMDGAVMRAYRLFFEVDPALESLYRERGLDLAEYNGEGRSYLPVPATFVIDRSGTVVAMHAQTDYKARMEPAAILEALSAL